MTIQSTKRIRPIHATVLLVLGVVFPTLVAWSDPHRTASVLWSLFFGLMWTAHGAQTLLCQVVRIEVGEEEITFVTRGSGSRSVPVAKIFDSKATRRAIRIRYQGPNDLQTMVLRLAWFSPNDRKRLRERFGSEGAEALVSV